MTSSLNIEDLTIGSGIEVTGRGQFITVHYVGRLEDGSEFDASYHRNEPFSFPVGVGYVIQGWDQGVIGMKVGGKRRLTVPAHLGYGARGAGDVIPPNATLIFEIELLNVTD